jgi:uncharacterized alpha-E superfamily protein
MRLLSRVADRLYWMARYLERVEDTARVTQSYTHLIMDIPMGTELGWDQLVNILDAQAAYESKYRAYNEQNVLKFLIADEDNPGSIRQSIRAARENVRTTRDVLPAEVWEHVNELYLYVKKNADASIGRRNRHQFLEEVINQCQILSGMVITTMTRDTTYRFMAIGHMVERADMTTRIIDVGAGGLMQHERVNPSVDPLIWGSLLSSLSAMSAYRRNVGPLPEAAPVVNFLFKEKTLPRSLAFCLNGLRHELGGLSKPDAALKEVDRARRRLSRFNAETASWDELHRFIDRIQLDLNSLSDRISQTWFLPLEQ